MEIQGQSDVRRNTMIHSDWHLHTVYSCDGACLEYEDLVAQTAALGVRDYGVTDHQHTYFNERDIAASRAAYEETMRRHPELAGHFHFGIEISVVSAWEIAEVRAGRYRTKPTYGLRTGGPAGCQLALALDEDFLRRYGIDYVVTGAHWPLYCAMDRKSLIEDYHRQYLYAARHPHTDILAHYLWWGRRDDVENPFADFDEIPADYRRELADALQEHGVAFELNLGAVLTTDYVPDAFVRKYLDYVCALQERGIALSIGSDCHDKHYTATDFARAEQLLARAGVDLTKNIFCL